MKDSTGGFYEESSMKDNIYKVKKARKCSKRIFVKALSVGVIGTIIYDLLKRYNMDELLRFIPMFAGYLGVYLSELYNFKQGNEGYYDLEDQLYGVVPAEIVDKVIDDLVDNVESSETYEDENPYFSYDRSNTKQVIDTYHLKSFGNTFDIVETREYEAKSNGLYDEMVLSNSKVEKRLNYKRKN